MTLGIIKLEFVCTDRISIGNVQYVFLNCDKTIHSKTLVSTKVFVLLFGMRISYEDGQIYSPARAWSRAAR